MLKISTEISSAAQLVGREMAVALTGQAGFDAWDFSMFDLSLGNRGAFRFGDREMTAREALTMARRLKQVGLDGGIHCNQSHAPFPTNDPKVRDCLKLALECTAEAGGSICVVHPMNDGTPEENGELFRSLLPFARDCGVKIATENMWNWEPGAVRSCPAACSTSRSFLDHLEAVGDDFLVACLDIGHGEMEGSGDGAAAMIRALGPHLQALHIHDNDRIHDSHQIPMSMQIDFVSVIRALKDIGYKGYLTLEADSYMASFTPETTLRGLKDLAASAKKLAELFEA